MSAAAAGPSTDRRKRGLGGVAVCVVLVATLAQATPASADLSPYPRPAYATDGRVDAIARHDDKVYIGGAFSWVAPTTGAGAAISPETAEPDLDLPKVSGGGGEIYEVIPDGEGGWYLGGWFGRVGGLPRRSLAHILADGTVDRDFAPDPIGNEYEVRALALGPGNTLYVGGSFSIIGPEQVQRENLAAVDADTGEIRDWQPQAVGGHDPRVFGLAVGADGTVYAGGRFTTIGANTAPRSHIAALDPQTANATPWNPSPVGDGIDEIEIAPDGTVYAGGFFTTIGANAAPRSGLAALHPQTANATAWNPSPQSPPGDIVAVRAIELAPDGTVYAGGSFTTIGANAVPRSHLAALDPQTANARSWNPGAESPPPPTTTPVVLDLEIAADGTVYVGGYFKQAGANGAPRHNLAAIDPVSGEATAWDPELRWAFHGGVVYGIAVGEDAIYAGGDFGAMGGERRENLAALRASDGSLTGWRADALPPPNRSAVIRDLATGPDGTLYVGGYFATIGADAASRGGIAALDPESGETTPWDPKPTFTDKWGETTPGGRIETIEIAPDGTIYVGGVFTGIGANAVERRNLAALDPETAEASDWNPNATNGPLPLSQQDGPEVMALALGPEGTVYAGGLFTTIGANAAARNNLAAIDPQSANATAWNPNPSGQSADGTRGIMSLDVGHDGTVYVGGAFTSIGGVADRGYLAAVDPASGNATAWDPRARGGATLAIEVGPDGTVYAAGNWLGEVGAGPTAGSDPVALDPETAAADPNFGGWPNWFVYELAAAPDGTLYAGGDFTNMRAPAQGFAIFGALRPAPAGTAPPRLTGSPAVGARLACEPGSWSGELTYHVYEWLRDGAPLAAAADDAYTVAPADAGHRIACRVSAHNWDAFSSAESDALDIPAAPAPDPNPSGAPDEDATTGSQRAGSSAPATAPPPDLEITPSDAPSAIIERVRVDGSTSRGPLAQGIPIAFDVASAPARIVVSLHARRKRASLRAGQTARYVVLGRERLSISRPGPVRVAVALSRRGGRLLERKDRLRSRVRLAATAADGSQRVTRSVLLRARGSGHG